MLITTPQAPRADHALAAARSAPAAPLPMADAAKGYAAPASFANLLRQQQAGPAERPGLIKPPDGQPGAEAADAAEPEPHEADATMAKPRTPARVKARSTDKPSAPAPHAAAGPADAATAAAAATATEAEANKRAAERGTPTMDPALAAWLAALHAAPVAPATDSTGAAEGHAQSIDDPLAANDAAGPANTRTRTTTGLQAVRADKADTAERAAQALAQGDATNATNAANATTAQRTARVGDASTALTEVAAPPPVEHKTASAALNVAAFNPAPTALREVAPPPTVLLPTPFDAADFSQALGIQVSVLARGGVQHAELQLNPAEMGPVSVQIVMDGTRAQVDFGADMAATRQAIEAGMPALASALRDAGFTLAGGGVSQHSRGRSDNSDERGQAVNGTRGARRLADDAQRDAEATARTTTRRTVRLGGLDLYA